jgi:beta-barrel assembly-enhancing protease
MKKLVLLLAVSASPAIAAPTAEQIAGYRALTALDARVATVGYQLAAASTPFCKHKLRNPGWVLHGIGQYPDVKTARAAFGFNRWSVNIAAVVPGGPAAQLGLSAGDAMMSLNGTRWDKRMHILPFADEDGVEDLRQTFDRLWAQKGTVEVEFETQREAKLLNFAPPPICASDFWVDTRNKLDAGADGERVRITSALVEYVASDDELAAVIAHELSHNLLGHRARLDATKKGKTRAIRTTEEEADRLSVWLMVNAGYDPKAALRFWERYGRQYGLGIFTENTHHQWKTRVAMMQAELDLIAKTAATDGLRDPPLLQAYRYQQ